jgi:hypothetical protein
MDLESRLPVWQACSNFYLDSDMPPETLIYIAKVCAVSPYSSRQLDSIMFCEVWPALKWNLFSMAGEWAGWRDNELMELVLSNYRRRLNICWWLTPIKLFYCFRWLAVKRRVAAQRAAAP